MARIEKATPAHYETHEVPFGRSYQWHPEYIIVECDCGQKLHLTGTSNLPSCPECGADYAYLVHEIHWGTRTNTPGTTMSRARQTNTYETRKLVPRIRPGSTMMLRRGLWATMKRDGRRLGSGEVFRPANGGRAGEPLRPLFHALRTSEFPRRPPLGSWVNRGNLTLVEDSSPSRLYPSCVTSSAYTGPIGTNAQTC